ncbi:MAG: MFS transporter [Chloroflexi bacterium]|nr:MAG: MFS transporter [Chloroflexota bacterium]
MNEAIPAADRGVLRNRAFLAIWSAQILSQVAANAVTSALIILVAEITHSNTSSSLLILLAVLPAVLFGIAGGVIVDRADKRLVLMITNALRAAAIVPLLLFGTSLTVVYTVSFLVAAVTIFFVPAESAMIPGIVRKRDLLVANSLFTFTFNGAFLVGFIILAPVVVSLYGYEILWTVIAMMFAIASLLCSTLPPSPPPTDKLSPRVAEMAVAQTRQGMAEAFRYLRSTPLVTWALVYIALTYTLVAVAGALAPGFVREVLKVGERNVVILVAPAGIGVIFGLALLNIIGPRIGRSRTIGAGLIVTLTALLGLAAARPFAEISQRLSERVGAAGLGEAFPFFVATVAGTAFVFGIAYSFVTVPSMTLLQEELRDDIRGRVFGVLNMLISVFSLLPLVLVGPIADVWGVAPVFVVAAVIVGGVWVGGRSTRGGRPIKLVTE